MNTGTRAWVTSLSIAMLALLSACSRQEQAPAATAITGTLSFRTPVSFESGATLELRLTDVSVSDGPALKIAHTTLDHLQALPYQYALPYEAGKIDPQHRYTVDARILVDGKLRFSTDTAFEVLGSNGTRRNITLVAIGENDPQLIRKSQSADNASMFQNELRTDSEVSVYRAGLQDGHILWLEEDRSTGTATPLHARYEFKGALVLRYIDTSPLEINFDERGRPAGIVKNKQALPLAGQMDAINAVRNRAALLRSHALAASETRAHRQATGG